MAGSYITLYSDFNFNYFNAWSTSHIYRTWSGRLEQIWIPICLNFDSISVKDKKVERL